MIFIQLDACEKMLEDAQSTFPDECCGFLFGQEINGERHISEIMIVDNAKEGDKRRRFEITAKDYLRAERFSLKFQLELLGVYHSHPSHPAIPSEHDRVAALPFFSYVIVSIFEDHKIDVRSWRLNDERQFDPEAINAPPLEIQASNALTH
ncbi:MAG: M67 family metallopeptidase [Saprospiraceae bacterium]|nr:M67 family metallopeptidase [Saprospiraceae bacterium]